MKKHLLYGLVLISPGPLAAAIIDLGGPATGYLAVANFKNSANQNGIEGRNPDGSLNPGHNGLPDFPNYQIPAGHTYAGVWTAIITATPYAGADYSPLYAHSGVSAGDVTVNNLTTTAANHSTMSAGTIGFDDSLLSGGGTVTIPVSALTFNLDTYAWDGKTGGDNAGWNVTSPMYISPFSPIYTDYNDGTGAGNASLVYNLSLSNITGTGLTFVDGQLVSMDIDADLSVLTRVGYVFGPSHTFTGKFSASGLNYQFDLDDTGSVFLWSDLHMVMNRAGTVVPEPSAPLLGVLASLTLLRRRRTVSRS